MVLAFLGIQDGSHLLAIGEDAVQRASEHVEHPDAVGVFGEDVSEQ
jgi:hypothetical protein